MQHKFAEFHDAKRIRSISLLSFSRKKKNWSPFKKISTLIEFILDLHKPEDYKNKVLDYVKKYATEDALNGNGESKNGDDMDDDSESMSDYDDDTDDGDLNMEM